MAWGFKSEGNRSVIRQDGVDRVAFNEDGSMELLTPAANPTGNDVPTAGQLGFGKMYQSGQQAFTNGGAFSLDHLLGAVPSLVAVDLVCVTAEGGYSAGDIAAYHATGDADSATRGISMRKTSTQLIARVSSGGVVLVHATTGAGVVLTPANWRLIVRAWA